MLTKATSLMKVNDVLSKCASSEKGTTHLLSQSGVITRVTYHNSNMIPNYWQHLSQESSPDAIH